MRGYISDGGVLRLHQNASASERCSKQRYFFFAQLSAFSTALTHKVNIRRSSLLCYHDSISFFFLAEMPGYDWKVIIGSCTAVCGSNGQRISSISPRGDGVLLLFWQV